MGLRILFEINEAVRWIYYNLSDATAIRLSFL